MTSTDGVDGDGRRGSRLTSYCRFLTSYWKFLASYWRLEASNWWRVVGNQTLLSTEVFPSTLVPPALTCLLPGLPQTLNRMPSICIIVGLSLAPWTLGTSIPRQTERGDNQNGAEVPCLCIISLSVTVSATAPALLPLPFLPLWVSCGAVADKHQGKQYN